MLSTRGTSWKYSQSTGLCLAVSHGAYSLKPSSVPGNSDILQQPWRAPGKDQDLYYQVMQSCERGPLSLQDWVVPNSKTSKYRIKSLKTAVVSEPHTVCCLLRFLSPSRYPEEVWLRAYADGAGLGTLLGCTAHSGPSTTCSLSAGLVVAGSSALL